VDAILEGKSRAVRADRAEAMVFPREAAPGEESSLSAGGDDRPPPVPVPAVMTLVDALRIATKANREYVRRTESLYLSGLALTGERFRFSPRFTAALSYVTKKSLGSEAVDTATGEVTASQVLPTGGVVSATGSSSGTRDRGGTGDLEAGTDVSASLRQPLLRGAGYESSHESLTQAERGVVYAIRDFARFREQFLIDVTRKFYDILSQRTVLRNTQERYTAVEYQVRRARALFDIGKQDKIEVLRAENEELRVRNAVINARDALGLSIDQFKVFLGLPVSVRFDVAEEEPPFRRVDVSLDSAVAAALANRFDLANDREQLEDAERALRIARRNLLPDLSLQADWNASSPATSRLLDHRYGDRTGSVGLFLEIPLQQTLERNSYRQSEIALDRQHRTHQEFRDNVVVEVRDTLRRLRQAAVGLEIQESTIRVVQKLSEKAQIDFDSGRIGNRDLLEAQQSLTDAKNERVRLVVDYEIARINLERSMGTLEVQDDGSWSVLRAPVAAIPAPGAGGRNP
jgi:outer membrane protein TolC